MFVAPNERQNCVSSYNYSNLYVGVEFRYMISIMKQVKQHKKFNIIVLLGLAILSNPVRVTLHCCVCARARCLTAVSFFLFLYIYLCILYIDFAVSRRDSSNVPVKVRAPAGRRRHYSIIIIILCSYDDGDDDNIILINIMWEITLLRHGYKCVRINKITTTSFTLPVIVVPCTMSQMIYERCVLNIFSHLGLYTFEMQALLIFLNRLCYVVYHIYFYYIYP